MYGNIVENCPSIKYAVEKYKLSKTAIGNVLSKRSKTTGGYYIILTKELEDPSFDIKSYIKSLNNSVIKIVYKYDLNGNLLEALPSITEYSIKYKYNRNAISKAIKNKIPYKDMYWSYDDAINISEFKSIYKYEWNNKKYRSLPEISRELNIPQGTVGSCFYKNKPLQGHKINKL